MDKQEYITRQLERTRGKRYENYVVTRIWHKLDDLTVKIVTQQYVARPEGRALSDLYFPQLRLHVEVNEGHHFESGGQRVESDIQRARDVVNATQHQFEDINVCNESLERINEQVDDLVNRLKARIAAERLAGEFIDWDMDKEFNPNTYINRGEINVADSVAFRTIVDACNCFGHCYEGVQRAFVPHGVDSQYYLWFPKLYANRHWRNSTNADETEIHEIPVTPTKLDGMVIRDQADYRSWFLRDERRTRKRIVFAHAKDVLGVTLYRFKGVYQFDEGRTQRSGTHLVYAKVDDKADTYPMPTRPKCPDPVGNAAPA